MATTDSDSDSDTVRIRAAMLEKLETLIKHSEKKCVSGRVKDPAAERIRIGWAQVSVSGIKAYLAGLRDQDLDVIDQRLSTLEGGKP